MKIWGVPKYSQEEGVSKWQSVDRLTWTEPLVQTMSERSSQATQLEFNQAMTDFKIMFPNMDIDVIEAVLRKELG